MKKQIAKHTLFLIDGSSFLYRAYYALRPMTTPQGVPVGAVYGFCRMIKKLLDDFQPEHLVLTWDSKGPTERHEMLSSYKATRQAAPSDLGTQKELIQKFADIIGMCQVQKPGVEADDLMYSLAQDFVQQGYEIILVTSDKDMGQMVSDKILMYDAFKDIMLDQKAVEEKYGFPLEKLPFYFALIGDTSDNIPGVAGVGPKTAVELVQKFESLEDLYKKLDQVPRERTRELLTTNKENAFLSKELFLLRYHKLGLEIDHCKIALAQWTAARHFFEELSFKSLLKEMPAKEKLEWLSEKHGFSFTWITDEAELERVCHEIKKKRCCAFDTETDGLSPYQAHIMGISLCCEVGKAYYIPLNHAAISQQLSQEQVLAHLKPIFESETIKKYAHNAKFDQLVLSKFGIEVNDIAFDTLLAAHLVTPDGQRLGLKFLSTSLLQQEMVSYDDLMKTGPYKNFADVPLDKATEYAAGDAHQTFQLVPILEAKLKEQKQWKLYTTIELPVNRVLFEMEKEGIICNPEVLHEVDKKVSHELKIIRNKIVSFLGDKYKDVNLSSPKQIEEILFHTLKLTPVKKTSKKTGFSTDQEVLNELAKTHPIPGLILRFRELSKLKSTYIDALPTYINPLTGRIHSSFSQTGTATGRLASSEPNLQNIPVDIDHEFSIRDAFEAPRGERFISADYSQIELRVLAYFSQEPQLINAFVKGEDIHALTAAGIFGVKLDEVTSKQRQLGKRINFSIMYGLTPYGLSKDLDISVADAHEYITKFFEQYPKVSAWMERVIEETKEHGYVTTHWGRRRYLPGIYEKNKTLYDLAHRMAINTIAQGTSAELVKLGMIQVHEQLQKMNDGAKIVLQIHDELLITVPTDAVEKTEKFVTKTLESVVDWNVPLVVNTRHGKTWGDVTK